MSSESTQVERARFATEEATRLLSGLVAAGKHALAGKMLSPLGRVRNALLRNDVPREDDIACLEEMLQRAEDIVNRPVPTHLSPVVI